MRKFALTYIVLIGLGVGTCIWRELAPVLPPLSQFLTSQSNAQAIVASVVITKPVYKQKSRKQKRTSYHNSRKKSLEKLTERTNSSKILAHSGDSNAAKAHEEFDPLISNIQRELLRLGCYDGVSTGEWDQNTSAAIARFSQRAHLAEPLGQSHEFLSSLQKYEKNFCRPGMNVTGIADAYLPPWQKTDTHILTYVSLNQNARVRSSTKYISSYKYTRKYTSSRSWRKKITWRQLKRRKYIMKRYRRHKWTPTGWPQGRW